MSATPHLRSSYPPSPGNDTPTRSRTGTAPLPTIPQASTSTTTTSESPIIPLNIVDAPTQRFYVLALYIALLSWRLWDWTQLVQDEEDSFWFFIKWVAVDAVFLYGLPSMRIPWLEWSQPTITSVFLAHAVFNGMLMFRIALPIEGWLAALAKMLYDRELSVSENRVKPYSILHNSSLIMGRQIINILPEGSATMNPEGLSFCLDSNHPSVKIPIRVNQTKPVQIELLRIDFDANDNETVYIKPKEARAMIKQAEKHRSDDNEDGMLVLEYMAKKKGLYRLQRVIDETKLEVQRRMSDTLVVSCPTAYVMPVDPNKCIGELSNLTLQVQGTPPLKIVYSRTINREDQSFHFQSIQPENLISPLLGAAGPGTLLARGQEDVSWARSYKVDVPLNESMSMKGEWLYSIDEVHDATGNVANFSARGEDGEHIYPKNTNLQQAFILHERPRARLEGCDIRTPLRVAKGGMKHLPVQYDAGRSPAGTQHTIRWQYSPIDTLTANGEHGDTIIDEEFVAKNSNQRPIIHRPGLYTLKSVSSGFCDGEIREPSSCMLLNPPEPELSISSEDIYDKCAGSSIGLLVDLDLIGTPPFIVRYEISRKGDRKPTVKSVQVQGLRHQLELKPSDAGHYTYRFKEIDDNVYTGHPLIGEGYILEQDVKPPASAHFVSALDRMAACIEEPVSVQVQLQGEQPFTLEYELVHGGKRHKQKVTDITGNLYTIATALLSNGGEYSLALASVQDRTGCKIFLKDEVKIDVRRQRPKASFGQIDGKRSTMTLESKHISLPLRLTGEAPWTIKYRNLDESPELVQEAEVKYTNDIVKVNKRGLYEIMEVRDNHCPGSVDSLASTFAVDWIPRPGLKFAESSALVIDAGKYLKREVCESDVDAVEVKFHGSPPYHLKYQQRHKPAQGSPSVSNKEFDVALGVATINLDTSKAGVYEYKFSELADNLYDHDPRKFTPLLLEQKVNSKPTAKFAKPGQSYKYCKEEEAGDEIIPITLTGQPPFHLEIDIKHQSSARPETVKIANVETHHYDFRIPHRVLSLGTHHVSVRKVRDARGCQQKTEYGAPHVQVQVFDVPTIYPLESQTDFCVGEHISYTLSGTAPFEIYYDFGGTQRKAKSPNTNFRRIAETAGNFTITAITDKASDCKARTSIMKIIHEMPSVKISQGRQVEVDIHEGGEAEILFEFWGTPPFEFTYTRSTNARKGQKSQVLETRHDISYEHSKRVRSSQEGTYEVVAIKDKYCAFSTQRVEAKGNQKLLKY